MRGVSELALGGQARRPIPRESRRNEISGEIIKARPASVFGKHGGGNGGSGGGAPRRPNFLFLLADDHAGYVLGCDGNGLAPTPNLDELAREGTRFARHYCNSPVCTPSRQSFFTGQLPHTAGVTRLPTPLALDKPTLAKQFKAAGYGTAVFGKMHLNRAAAPGLFGFDVMMTENEIRAAWMKDVKPQAIPPNVHETAVEAVSGSARIWLNAEKLPYPRIEAEMLGTYIADRAVGYLEENAAKPFAMWVSFMEPHSPFDFPVEYRDRFDARRFGVPRVGPKTAGRSRLFSAILMMMRSGALPRLITPR